MKSKQKIDNLYIFIVFFFFIGVIIAYLLGIYHRTLLEPLCNEYNGKMLNNSICLIKEDGVIKEYQLFQLEKKKNIMIYLINKK